MRTLALAAAFAAATLAHAASAQTLLAANNDNSFYYGTFVNAPWQLDNAGDTTLSFVTTKARETVQIGFSGLCGVYQVSGDGSGGALSANTVQAQFYVDGQAVTGFSPTMCQNISAPQPVNAKQVSNSVLTRSLTVPAAGSHKLQVVVQILPSSNGSNLLPVFGPTYVSVSK